MLRLEYTTTKANNKIGAGYHNTDHCRETRHGP